tara:strand:- start:852 stop:2060 length:1209 start_codon:yes stop_codon:yes gene_type:complete
MIFWLIILLEGGLKEENKHSSLRPMVTILIPAYNEETTIKGTVQSVIDLDYPKENREIIIVNDGSTDNTQHMINAFISNHPNENIQLINQKNQGKGVALNTGLRMAKGEYFTCLDADSTVASDCLIRMLPHFEEKDVAAVLPLMKVRNPKTLLERVQWVEYLINLFYKKLMSYINCVHVAPGPFSVYKTQILRSVGGFDEKNLTEDLEISMRLQKYHYKIKQLIGPEVYTKAPKTLKAVYKQRNRWYKGTTINIWKYKNLIFNKKYGDFGILQMPWVILAGVLTVILFLLTNYHFIIIPIKDLFINLKAIHFDFFVMFKNWEIFALDKWLFGMNYMNVSLAFFGLILAIVTIYLSYKATREKFTKERMFITIPAYLLIYGIIIAIAWTSVVIDLIRGNVQKW